MARSPDFDLAAALAQPNFTPAQKDVGALVELVARGDERAPAALAGLGERARGELIARLERETDEAAHARVVSALGLLARRGDAIATARVIDTLAHASPRVRRAAISALGKLAGDHAAIADARAALLARWDAGDVTADERRALAEALGKLGGDDALARLRALDPAGDAELARRRDRALLIAHRTAQRDAADESSVRDDVAPLAPITVLLHCKAGLAELLVDELKAHAIAARALVHDRVELVLAAPWRTLWASRLWSLGALVVPRPPGELAESVTRGIVAARPLLAAWTRGPIRWRLDVPHGKQRAIVWRVARDVTAAAPELVNDPTETTWDIAPRDGVIELRPRKLADPRFAYRVADIPAASHPTIAAALAFVAGARAADRVWDPFAGSGLELIERAKLGPVRSLAGTDLAPAALDAARANLAAAGVHAELVRGDSRAAAGTRDLDLAITNPPLGSRVQLDAPRLLGELLPVIARRLARGGRLVWITPAPRHTGPIAERAGLRCALSRPIDLGGVTGQLERWDQVRT